MSSFSCMLSAFTHNRFSGYFPGLLQGGHKPGILRDFSERGKLGEFCEFCATSGKNCNKRSILVRYSNICVKQLLTGGKQNHHDP